MRMLPIAAVLGLLLTTLAASQSAKMTGQDQNVSELVVSAQSAKMQANMISNTKRQSVLHRRAER